MVLRAKPPRNPPIRSDNPLIVAFAQAEKARRYLGWRSDGLLLLSTSGLQIFAPISWDAIPVGPIRCSGNRPPVGRSVRQNAQPSRRRGRRGGQDVASHHPRPPSGL